MDDLCLVFADLGGLLLGIRREHFALKLLLTASGLEHNDVALLDDLLGVFGRIITFFRVTLGGFLLFLFFFFFLLFRFRSRLGLGLRGGLRTSLGLGGGLRSFLFFLLLNGMA